MTALVIRADARVLPLPDASVDLIVTSPPYWGLRSYTDDGQHYDGQIGDEPTPQAYIAALLECTAEWARVLKSAGSVFVNLGDKYANRTRGAWRGSSDGYTSRGHSPRYTRPKDMPEKSLMLLPERYRIGCVDDLELIARAVIIWNKPNGLPESVTDRVRRSHEDWVHLTKEPRYYSAVDEIREPHTDLSAHAMSRRHRTDARLSAAAAGQTSAANPLGKLPGSVWEIATQPLQVPERLSIEHFAAFPMEWPRRIIRGWSPPGICLECDEGRQPVAHRSVQDPAPTRRIPGVGRDPYTRHGQIEAGSTLRGRHASVITGYACSCPTPAAPTRPAVVLDPFGGTGTTALLASALGRTGISADRSGDYCRIAAWRTTDPRERARALGVRPPAPVSPEQGDLFATEDIA